MTLLDLLVRRGIPIPAGCAGRGRCGQCRIRITKPRRPDEIERGLIPSHLLQRGYRLACRRSAREKFVPVIWARPQGRATRGRDVGLALDLGTTTIKGLAVDLGTGKTIGRATVFNPQNARGADVISRIGAALTGSYDSLHGLLMSGIRQIQDRLGIQKPVFTVVVGNPVMLSFYLGKSVAGLGGYPFKSQLEDGIFLKNPNRYVFPIVGGFVGGDTIAGLLAAGVLNRRKTTLYVDLGTNGEVGLCHRGKMVVASTAAGPAFEGVGIKAGSLAVPGAIDQVIYRRGMRFHTIGNRKPVGLCASGLLDLLAVLRRMGRLKPDGRLDETARVAGVSIDQQDIRKLQLAIGAIHAGIDTLLTKSSIRPGQVDELIITGEFGGHLNPRSMVALGLVPRGIKKIGRENDLPIRGAVRFLLEDRVRSEIKTLQRNCRHIELALEKDFEKRFVKALRLEPWD